MYPTRGAPGGCCIFQPQAGFLSNSSSGRGFLLKAPTRMCSSGRACTKAILGTRHVPRVSSREGRQHVPLWWDRMCTWGRVTPWLRAGVAVGRGVPDVSRELARVDSGPGVSCPGAYLVIPQWGPWIGVGFQNACPILKKRKVLRCSNSFFSDAESKPGTIWICRSPEITGHV